MGHPSDMEALTAPGRDPRLQEVTVAAERSRAVRCPACQTKYIVSRGRDRFRCFQCERMLIIGIEAEDTQ